MRYRFSIPRSLAQTVALILICGSVHGHIRVDYSRGLETRIKEIALSFVGICELTGKNDGPVIEAIIRSVNAPAHSPYCAATVDSVLRAAGVINTPRSAWSPSFFPIARRIYWANKLKAGFEIQVGDIPGYYFPKLKRIGHVGINIGEFGDFKDNVEANTSNALTGEGLRNGGCILRKNVHKRRIYAYSRWKDQRKENLQ